jgi:hypothetical protein
MRPATPAYKPVDLAHVTLAASKGVAAAGPTQFVGASSTELVLHVHQVMCAVFCYIALQVPAWPLAGHSPAQAVHQDNETDVRMYMLVVAPAPTAAAVVAGAGPA